ncbi:MAG TPA: hypothetical protein VG389_05410 [Myxococcota bacterium]|jgi:hypothetical protein|nr:hypothetical protein [Myxococcota bacterium]
MARRVAVLAALVAATVTGASAPAPATAAAATPAAAKKTTVTVFRFVGPGAEALYAAVVKALAASGKVSLVSRDKFLAAAKKAKIPAAALTRPADIARAARAARVDAVVRGVVVNVGGRAVLRLESFGAAGGATLWSADLPLAGGRLGKSEARVSGELAAALAAAGPARRPTGGAAAGGTPLGPPPALEPSGGAVVPIPGGEGEGEGGGEGDGTDDRPGRVRAVRLEGGAGLLFRKHRASSPGFSSTRPDLCAGFVCFSVAPFAAAYGAVDLHPGAFAGDGPWAVPGLEVRYVQGFLPGRYEALDPATGEFAPTDVSVGYREVVTRVHGELALGGRLPTLEPAAGIGALDLRVGPNALGLVSLFYLYGSAGLRVSEPLVPGLLALSVAGEARLVLDVGADAEDAYGAFAPGRSLGWSAAAEVVVTPLAFLRLSAGWSWQRTTAHFRGTGTSGQPDVRLVDSIHALTVGVGVVFP